jgi:hypothetical protein
VQASGPLARRLFQRIETRGRSATTTPHRRLPQTPEQWTERFGPSILVRPVKENSRFVTQPDHALTGRTPR